MGVYTYIGLLYYNNKICNKIRIKNRYIIDSNNLYAANPHKERATEVLYQKKYKLYYIVVYIKVRYLSISNFISKQSIVFIII